ncbi:MAG: family 43 glycosylhydrolase [Phycisphaerales bacterium]|nr:family 43 glycosylhydrolase [Phycisphaerales bacterium]
MVLVRRRQIHPTYQTKNARGIMMARADVVGVACYRSRDLLHWERTGLALSAMPDSPFQDLHPGNVLERPKVIHHRQSGTFVMWMHIDRADYGLAATGVAIAEHPQGPFRYLATTRPSGRDSRDQTVFVDDDGCAYHLCSTDKNDTAMLTRLSDDYRSFSDECKVLFPNRRMEAHAIARCQGRYWYLASGCTGWAPNAARSAVADNIWGPWTELDNPCQDGPQPELTWGAQSTFYKLCPMGECWQCLIFGNPTTCVNPPTCGPSPGSMRDATFCLGWRSGRG